MPNWWISRPKNPNSDLYRLKSRNLTLKTWRTIFNTTWKFRERSHNFLFEKPRYRESRLRAGMACGIDITAEFIHSVDGGLVSFSLCWEETTRTSEPLHSFYPSLAFLIFRRTKLLWNKIFCFSSNEKGDQPLIMGCWRPLVQEC